MDRVVFFPVLLYRDVGEMHEHVIELVCALRVLHCAEATEPKSIHVAFQWTI